MLTFDVMKKKAGIQLFGDYRTLRALHAVVHKVNEESSLIVEKDGSFLGLAYDIRKAYEGMRLKRKPNPHYPEIGPEFGVPIIWPVFLAQLKALRVGLAYIPSDKFDQSLTLMLEAIAEAALNHEFSGRAGSIIEAWTAMVPAHPGFWARVNGVSCIFCGWSPSKRAAFLNQALSATSGLQRHWSGSDTPCPDLTAEKVEAAIRVEDWPDPERSK